MTEPGQSSGQPPEEAVTFADEQEVEPAQEASDRHQASGPQQASGQDDIAEHRVNEGL